MMFQEIRDQATGHLLAKIDPQRLLLEIKRDKIVHTVDLLPYLQENGPQPAVESQEQLQQAK